MEQKPLLSICIPTYNRALCLKESLQSLVIQKDFLCGEVEVVIQDNASSDNTKEVAQEFCKNYPNIKYYRNEKNIFDKNFPTLLQKAEGVYRKLCNDTILYAPYAIQLFLTAIKKHIKEKPIVLFPCEHGTKTKDIDFVYKETCYLEPTKLMETLSEWSTWVGQYGFWEDDINQMENWQEGWQTHLWQVLALFKLLQKKPTCFLVNTKFIRRIVRTGIDKKDLSYGLFKVFYENFLEIANRFVENGLLTKDVYEKMRKDILLVELPSPVFQYKYRRKAKRFKYDPNEDVLEKIKATYKKEPYYWQYKKIMAKLLFHHTLEDINIGIRTHLKKIKWLYKLYKLYKSRKFTPPPLHYSTERVKYIRLSFASFYAVVNCTQNVARVAV